MRYKQDWERARNKWRAYWKRQNTGRPLMCVMAAKPECRDAEKEALLRPQNAEDKYFNAERIVERFRYFCETHEFMGESFPNLSVDLGPGSMAAYLGCEVEFEGDTVWYEPFVKDWTAYKPLIFDPGQKWFSKHLEVFRRARELAGEDFYLCIPDIIENLDILASMRGTQDIIFDMIDTPEEVKKRIAQIDDIYMEYYDRFYEIVRNNIGGSSYTVFQIWGEGRTAKLQCDFSALISPGQFREFVQPSLRKQAGKLDNVLYHLDGPDAIKHVDALMEIDEIDALQWTSGDHGPDGTMEEWYPIYDKAVAAHKSLWIKVYTGEVGDWIERVDRLVKRYGSNAMFLFFPMMERDQARRLLDHAEEHWSDVTGSAV